MSVIRYPERLAHNTPSWVESGVTYHIRISIDRAKSPALVKPEIAQSVMGSARFYHEQHRWDCRLFLLMPDHLHALLIFPYDQDMRRTIGSWKGFQAKRLGIRWQNNYFDHRIRNQRELEEKAAYIRLNPVRKSLCRTADAWPWMTACA
jgi:putative transposase